MRVLAQIASTLPSSKANLELLLKDAEVVMQIYNGFAHREHLALEVMRKAIQEPAEHEESVNKAAEILLAAGKAWATGFPGLDTLMPFVDREQFVSIHDQFEKSADELQQEFQRYVSNPSDVAPATMLTNYERSVATLDELVQFFQDFRTRVMLALEFREIVPKTDNKPDSGSNSDLSVPENPLVSRLARLINRQDGKKSTKRDAALELTKGDEQAAESLLRQLRRFPNLLK